MAERNPRIPHSIESLLFVNRNGKYCGYKLELISDNIGADRREFLICAECKGISRRARQRKGKTVCEVCVPGHSMGEINKRVGNTVASLKAICPLSGEGCDWEGKLGGIEQHMEECLKVRLERQLECGISVERGSYEQDNREACSFKMKRCDYCNQKVHAKEENRHKGKCQYHPNTEVPCPYKELGCEVIALRKNMNTHITDNMENHQKLMLDKMNQLNQLRNKNQQLERVNHQQKNKNEELERVNIQQKIRNQQQQRVNVQQEYRNEELEEVNEQHENRNQQLERIYVQQKNRNEELERVNEQHENRNHQLERANEQQKNNNEQRRKRNEKLERLNVQQKYMNEELERVNEQHENRNQQLERVNEQQKNENEELEIINEQQKNKNEQRRNRNEKLERIYVHHKYRNEELERVNEQHENRNQQLERVNEQQKNNNEQRRNRNEKLERIYVQQMNRNEELERVNEHQKFKNQQLERINVQHKIRNEEQQKVNAHLRNEIATNEILTTNHRQRQSDLERGGKHTKDVNRAKRKWRVLVLVAVGVSISIVAIIVITIASIAVTQRNNIKAHANETQNNLQIIEPLLSNASYIYEYIEARGKFLPGIEKTYDLTKTGTSYGPTFSLRQCKLRLKAVVTSSGSNRIAIYYVERLKGEYDDSIDNCRITYAYTTFRYMGATQPEDTYPNDSSTDLKVGDSKFISLKYWEISEGKIIINFYFDTAGV